MARLFKGPESNIVATTGLLMLCSWLLFNRRAIQTEVSILGRQQLEIGVVLPHPLLLGRETLRLLA